jgi:hypothetical protein
MNDDPAPFFAEFIQAVEAALHGDQEPPRALVRQHPIIEGELRAFIAAAREGRLVKVEGAWRPVKTRGRVRAAAPVPRGYGLDAGIPTDTYEDVAARLLLAGSETGGGT